MDFFLIVCIGFAFLAQLGTIVLLLRQLDRLQNKLMARDYSEYAMYNRDVAMKKGGNFIQESISKAYRERKNLAAGEGMDDE